jgi:hypothetical protein
MITIAVVRLDLPLAARAYLQSTDLLGWLVVH